MPHDAHGHAVAEGDTVWIPFTVTAIYTGETACNFALVAQDRAETGEYKPQVSCNSGLAYLDPTVEVTQNA